MTDPHSIVFVVDDDDSLRDALKRLIRSVGLQVEHFASAEEFLQRKQLDAPGCLILDIRLRESVGSISSASWLRPTSSFRSSLLPDTVTFQCRFGL